MRSRVLAFVACLVLGGSALPVQAGSQPSVGVVKYSLDAQISQARAALRLAKTTLSDALERSKSLVRKAERTVDLKAKVKLLQEAADLLTTAKRLRDQINGLEASLEKLGIAKEVYENQLALEKKAAELAEQQRLEAQQLAAQEVAARAVEAASAAPTKPDAPAIKSMDGLSPVAREVVERVADLNLSIDNLRKIADNATYAVLANAAYAFKAPDGWTVVDKRTPTLSNSGVAATAFRSTEGDRKEIVISFRGSVTATDWAINNLGLFLSMDVTSVAGRPGSVLGAIRDFTNDTTRVLTLDRFNESLAFAQEVIEANRGSKITITGHSLGGGIAHYVAASLGEHAVAFDPAPIAEFLDDVGKSELKSYDDIANFRNGNDPLTKVELGVIGKEPTTIANTHDVPWSEVDSVRSLIDIVGVNHSSDGLAIAMSSVEFARCYLEACTEKEARR